MNDRVPSYLKLHREEPTECCAPALSELPDLVPLFLGFEQATGWQMQFVAGNTIAISDEWSEIIRDGSGLPIGRLTLQRPADCQSDVVPLARVRLLAESLTGILSELARSHHVIWQREAELAAGVPVTAKPDSAIQLAERLESVLRAGAESVGCQAAALYLLDDGTSQLKMRSCWGLPKTRLLERARPLRGAIADLEAMLGHAVVLDDTSKLPHWKSPEGFPAAVCVPVSTSSTPLGTLWIFSAAARDFSDSETQLIEIVAGRLAADLERETLVREGVRTRQLDRQIQTVADWQHSRLPSVKPLLDGWDIASVVGANDCISRQFHDWFVLSNGLLALAVGKSSGETLAACLHAAAVHAAMKAIAGYSTDTRDLMNRLNETIWTSGAGDQYASLFYGLLNPDDASLEWIGAGEVRAMLVRGSAYKTLDADVRQLGSDPDAVYRRRGLRIKRGDTLVIYANDEDREDGGVLADDIAMARMIRRSGRATADQLVAEISDEWNRREGVSQIERSLVLLRRL